MENELANLRAELSWSEHANREKTQRIEELQDEVVKWGDLKEFLGIKTPVGFFDHLLAKDNRITELESLLSETMRVMKLYINVPEFDDLRDRWEALQKQ